MNRRDLEKQLPRLIGLFLLGAVLSNSLALWLLEKPVPVGAWGGRIGVLALGLLAAAYPGDWSGLLAGSGLLRKLRRR